MRRCCSDRTRDKADGVDAERLQCADERIGGREIQVREDERRDKDIKQEIIRLDNRADRAGKFYGAGRLRRLQAFRRCKDTDRYALVNARYPLDKKGLNG